MKINCPCDKSFEIEHNAKINLDKEPEILKKIADGSYLTFKCPQCGRNVRSEIKTRIEWPSKKLILLFVPEADRIACLSSCTGLKEINEKTKKAEKIEYEKADETPVIGYSELAERIAVVEAGLDPHAMEVLKFFILDSGKDIKGKKIKIFFHSINDDGSFEFYVYGLKEDQVAVMKIPVKLYNSICQDIKNKKKSEIFTAVYLGNYLSYQNIFTEGRDS